MLPKPVNRRETGRSAILAEWVVRHGWAGILALAALLLGLAVLQTTLYAPFLISYVAIVAAGLFLGFGPALVCVVIAVLTAWYFVAEPQGEFGWPLQFGGGAGRVVVLTGVGVALAALSAGYRNARRRAQRLLAEAQERLELAVSSAGVVAWDVDLLTEWVVCRGPALPIWGMEEGRREEFRARVHEEDRERLQQAVKEAEADPGGRFSCEFRVLAVDGSVRWLSSRGRCVRDESGRPVRLAGMLSDVTQRKQMEAALKESEAKVRVVLERGPLTAFEQDAELRYTWVHPIRPDRSLMVIGRTDAEIAPGADVEVLTELKRLVLRTGDGVREQVMLNLPWGTRWFEFSMGPKRDGAGEIVGIHGTALDVTEQVVAGEFTRFMAEASEVLASSLDYHTTLRAVSKLVVPRFADWCAVDLLREDGTLERVSVQHVDPEKVRLAHELMERYPIDLNERKGVAQVLRSGKPDLVPQITPEMMAAVTADEQHLKIMLELGLRSYIGVPLIARGRTLGALSFVSAESGRVYTQAHVHQAMELGRRAAVAVDNARLYKDSLVEIERRREAQERMTRSEARFRAAFEQAPFAIQRFTPAGDIIDANPAWERLWGTSRGALAGYNLLKDPQTEAFREEFERAFLGGEAVQIAAMLYDPARSGHPGRPRWIEAALYPIHDEQGRVPEVVLILSDVTERIHAQQESARSEERLRIALEAGRIGTWEWDIAANRVIWSPQLYEIHRLAVEAFDGTVEVFKNLVHPEDRERVDAALRRVMEDEQPHAMEFRAIAGDGQVQWLWSSARVIRGEDGKPLRVIGATLEITDRKQAEQAIAESNERFRLIYAATNDVLWDWDLGSNRLSWSESLTAATGWSLEEMGGSLDNWLERVHPEERDFILSSMRGAIEGGQRTWSGEYRLRRKDGSYATFLDRGLVARDAGGRAYRMIGSMLDLTERRRAEQALEDAYRRLNTVLTSITDGYIALDDQFRFLAVNPAAQRMVFKGRPLEDLIGKCFWDLYPQKRGTEIYRQYLRALEEQVDVHFEAHSAIADRWFEAHAYPRSFGLEVYVRDISERRKAAEDLQWQARELARSNKELQDFAYLASHDLKEPLRGIATYASILREDFAEKLGQPGLERVETISRLSKRMYGLLDALLEYSRIGRREIQRSSHESKLLVAEAIDSLRGRLENQHVEIVVAEDLPPVLCDGVGVVQIFVNLISNAVKYNTSALPRVEIGCREVDGQPAFFVRDNGIGIAEQHHGRVFGMFKRLHNRDEFGGGMGAGLAIVKKVVEHHGGRVWIESMPGEGATFWFTLAAPAMPQVQVPGARGMVRVQ